MSNRNRRRRSENNKNRPRVSQKSRKLSVQTLEARQLMVASIEAPSFSESFPNDPVPAEVSLDTGIHYDQSSGIVQVQGTSGDDLFIAEQVGENVEIKLRVNGNFLPSRLIAASDLDSIVVRGGAGNDYFLNRTDVPMAAFGGTGNDRILGGGGNDFIDGGEGNDLITGAGGKDALIAGPGKDRLWSEFSDVGSSFDESIDIVAHDATSAPLGQSGIMYDPIVREARIVGSEGDDFVEMRRSRNRLHITIKRDGQLIDSANLDFLLVRHVTFHGYQGDDSFTNHTTMNATALGGEDNDRLSGGRGIDFISGGPGEDRLYGGAGDDRIVRDDQDVVADGGTGRNRIENESPDKTISLNTVSGVLRIPGTPQMDRVSIDTDNESLTVLVKLADDSTKQTTLDKRLVKQIIFSGGQGNDAFHNRTDVPSIAYGGEGDDQLFGGYGNDILEGGAGNDIIVGREGRDTLLGNEGNDRVWRDNTDIVVGSGTGKDVVVHPDRADASQPIAHPGIIFDSTSGVVQIEGSNGRDSLEVKRSGNRLHFSLKRDGALVDSANLDSTYVKEVVFRGYGGNDFFINRTDIASSAFGGSGTDRLYGGSGVDHLDGGLHSDQIIGGAGSDTLLGGDGVYADHIWHNPDDALVGGGPGRDVGVQDLVYSGTRINDPSETGRPWAGIMHNPLTRELRIEGSRYGDVVEFDYYKDDAGNYHTAWYTVKVKTNGQVITKTFDRGAVDRLVFLGHDGNDVFRNHTNVASVALGGDGTDRLYGGSGADYLDGGLHSDQIIGGAGSDTLLGGDGVYADHIWHNPDDALVGGGPGKDVGVQDLVYSGTRINDPSQTGRYWAGIMHNPLTRELRIEGSRYGDVVEFDYYKDDAGAYHKAWFTVTVNSDGQELKKTFDRGAVDRLVFVGHDGNDVFQNRTHIESVAFGGAGNDTIRGGTGDDSLFGSEGVDRIFGGEGFDALEGGRGDDYLDMILGGDSIRGDDGYDTVNLMINLESVGQTNLGDSIQSIEEVTINVDAGFVITDIIAPVVENVQSLTRQFQPLIDALNQEVPVLSYINPGLTYKDLLEGDVSDFIDSVEAINQLDLKTWERYGVIEIGTVSLRDATESTHDAIKGFADAISIPGLAVPLLTSPQTLLDYAMGEDVTLIEYDTPDLQARIHEDISHDIPVAFGISVELGGSIGFDFYADAVFGYDTRGLRTGNLENGFYISKAEASVTATANVYAQGVLGVAGFDLARGGVRAELGGTITLEVTGLKEADKVYFDDINWTNPIYVHGKIDFGVEAYVEYRTLDLSWDGGISVNWTGDSFWLVEKREISSFSL